MKLPIPLFILLIISLSRFQQDFFLSFYWSFAEHKYAPPPEIWEDGGKRRLSKLSQMEYWSYSHLISNMYLVASSIRYLSTPETKMCLFK